MTRHFGPRTLRPQDTSAPVPKCPGHFGTGSDVSRVELGRFSKNGRSPIFRFYVSLFPISDSDPIFKVAEIALGFCSQQRVPVPGSVCCPPFSWRFRSTDNVGLQIHGQFSIHQWRGWRGRWRTQYMGQRVPSSLAAAVVCWRADLTARIAPRRLPTA